MAVKIDQGFLGALITMFTPSVDEHLSKKQVGMTPAYGCLNTTVCLSDLAQNVSLFTQLIVKDLDTLQEQLMETSKTDSSGLSFFEHFHISPIKVS